MEKFIKEIYNDKILQEAIERYGFNKSKIIKLDGFQSFVYECEKDDEPYILRITHSSHRSINLIKGELEWILYLKKNGISVASPILSKNKKMVESIDGKNSYFSAVSFEKVKGKPFTYYCNYPSKLIQKWGQITGKMHTLSKDYIPSKVSIKRPPWYLEDNYFADKFLPANQIRIKNKLRDLINKIKKFPKDRNSYGLIHADLHSGNFFVDKDEITIFDFDGCIYSWFIHDIAILLFCTIRFNYTCKDRNTFVHHFMNHFCKGYNMENKIDSYWEDKLGDFLKLEEIGEYVLVYRSYELDNLDELNRNFMENRRFHLENDVPYVDFVLRDLNKKTKYKTVRGLNEFCKCS